MKKTFLIIMMILLLLVLVGCEELEKEYYNEKDELDFAETKLDTVLFEFIQFKNVLDERTISNWNLSGSGFLFIGGIFGNGQSTTGLKNVYYGWVKHKEDGMFFVEIPATKVRVYQDSTDDKIYLVGAMKRINNNDGRPRNINRNEYHLWDEYEIFNLHIPEGTIIPRIDLDNMDVNNLLSK